MMLYVVWDVLFGVIGVVYVCGGGRWWVPIKTSYALMHSSEMSRLSLSRLSRPWEIIMT